MILLPFYIILYSNLFDNFEPKEKKKKSILLHINQTLHRFERFQFLNILVVFKYYISIQNNVQIKCIFGMDGSSRKRCDSTVVTVILRVTPWIIYGLSVFSMPLLLASYYLFFFPTCTICILTCTKKCCLEGMNFHVLWLEGIKVRKNIYVDVVC